MTFFHCCLEKGRIRRVKGRQVYLTVAVTLLVSVALAEDFKTITGKEYKDATIIRIEGDGIVIRNRTGISKVYFVELPKDVQEKFHPKSTPIAVQPNQAETKQDKPGQSHGGGKVVVVGQGAGNVKIFLYGIVLLLVIVLIAVRRRSS